MATSDENIRGGAQLAQFLATLPAKVEQNIMRSALRAGANVIRNEARILVPVDQGALRASIKTSAKARRGMVTAAVKAGGKLAPHAHLVEYGTRPHKIEPKDAAALSVAGSAYQTIDHPGAKPSPFMRPAQDSKTTAAIEAVSAQIGKRLTKEGINVPAPEEE